MTTDQEMKITKRVLEIIVQTLKLEGIDYFELDKKTQMGYFAVFQAGVNAVDNMVKENILHENE